MKCTKCDKTINLGYFLKPLFASKEHPLQPYCETCKLDRNLAYHGAGLKTVKTSAIKWTSATTFEYEGDEYRIPNDAGDNVYDDIALYPQQGD